MGGCPLRLQGQVLQGINNIYSVKCGPDEYECRIKGKILRNEKEAYNPLAAGDYVVIETGPSDPGKGMITERLDRKSEYSRWNRKRNAPQTIAANFDLLVVVASVDNPPFRPRFIDRVLVMSGLDVQVLIVLNKCDLKAGESLLSRMENYRSMGYDYIGTSVKTGEGLGSLLELLESKTSVFAGQSGVGKSSLLNSLFPGIDLKTGEISLKHNRGRHTTNYAKLIYTGNGDTGIIDTPGIREIEVFGIEPSDLAFYFPDIKPYTGSCRYTSCLHLEEPDCGVRKAVKEGKINSDRYESYKRILNDLSSRTGY